MFVLQNHVCSCDHVAVLCRGVHREAGRAVAEPEPGRLWALHVWICVSVGSQGLLVRPQLTERLREQHERPAEDWPADGGTQAWGGRPHRVERRPGTLRNGHFGRGSCTDTRLCLLHHWLGQHRRRQPASSATAAEVRQLADANSPQVSVRISARNSNIASLQGDRRSRVLYFSLQSQNTRILSIVLWPLWVFVSLWEIRWHNKVFIHQGGVCCAGFDLCKYKCEYCSNENHYWEWDWINNCSILFWKLCYNAKKILTVPKTSLISLLFIFLIVLFIVGMFWLEVYSDIDV